MCSTAGQVPEQVPHCRQSLIGLPCVAYIRLAISSLKESSAAMNHLLSRRGFGLSLFGQFQESAYLFEQKLWLHRLLDQFIRFDKMRMNRLTGEEESDLLPQAGDDQHG